MKKICEITKVFVIAKALFTSSCLNLAAKMKFMTSRRAYVKFNLQLMVMQTIQILQIFH